MTSVTVPAPRGGYSGSVLHLDIDPTEHQRRRSLQRRHIDDPSVLDLLMTLPVGALVAYRDLTTGQQDAVRRAPTGVLDFVTPWADDLRVSRLAVRPCRVSMATVRSATACKTALESASRFAPFCARQVIVRRRPKLAETLIEFDFWGVGLLLEHGDGGTETLVAPTPWRPMRHTVAGWRFAENAYAAYLTHNSAA
ncbi:hypothetical protein ACFRCX_30560 [Streptomyces sp. NPDC056652]|uniref:hypothetical protein n=1 Tax=Streptomyces sp. NPDC056652 TaxID=3345893 RepID=UPI0036BEFA6C